MRTIESAYAAFRAARSSTEASRQSRWPRPNHKKSKYVRRSRACAAWVFHSDDANHMEK
ncbi:hypothetical protein [Streptomyces sporangiiformans]|uniref:hypothetical protein n=1 Tax=Streptomyces sporangiiformans TaxID=2315329 RepID=UPI0013C5052A|nr:hypothetical protein [Streptomyces sporangiiformans]